MKKRLILTLAILVSASFSLCREAKAITLGSGDTRMTTMDAGHLVGLGAPKLMSGREAIAPIEPGLGETAMYGAGFPITHTEGGFEAAFVVGGEVETKTFSAYAEVTSFIDSRSDKFNPNVIVSSGENLDDFFYRDREMVKCDYYKGFQTQESPDWIAVNYDNYDPKLAGIEDHSPWVGHCHHFKSLDEIKAFVDAHALIELPPKEPGLGETAMYGAGFPITHTEGGFEAAFVVGGEVETKTFSAYAEVTSFIDSRSDKFNPNVIVSSGENLDDYFYRDGEMVKCDYYKGFQTQESPDWIAVNYDNYDPKLAGIEDHSPWVGHCHHFKSLDEIKAFVDAHALIELPPKS